MFFGNSADNLRCRYRRHASIYYGFAADLISLVAAGSQTDDRQASAGQR